MSGWLFSIPRTVVHQASTVHKFLQRRILEWVAVLSCRESSQPRDQTQVSHIAGRFLTFWVTGEAYLKLLLFLTAILIASYRILDSILFSPSTAFLMMYSAYKLNKQCDNIQPCRTLFPIWNQSVVPYLVLTVASWHAYRFLRIQGRCLVFLSL